MLTSNKNMHQAVFARKMSIMFDTAIKDAELRFRVERFLMDLTKTLKDERCELIGHIKGLFTADVAGYLMFSVTSHDEPVHFKGEFNSGITGAALTVNIIVYGVGPDVVETAFEKSFQKLCFTES